tara:strand:+ start:96 stop:299 length:204 start_codon:yes stop_codon:yes gene_type:complete
MTKNDLISHYVNLYRQLWLSNEGLWTDQLKQMSEKELKWGIKDMKRAIKEKDGYYPAFEGYYREKSA